MNDERWRFNGESPQPPMDELAFPTDINMGMGLDDSTFTWEMIGLGLEEPLPPQETIDELYVTTPININEYSAHAICSVTKSTSTKYIRPFQ